MKYPPLVLPCVCKTPVKVILTGENTDQGESTVFKTIETKCNRQTTVQNFRENERYIQKTKTTLYFSEALAGEDSQLKGYVEFAVDCKMDIISGILTRNPDGSVNHTKLVVE